MANNNGSSNNSSTMDVAMEKLMQKSFAELEKADRDAEHGEVKTVKLFGLFEAPASMATIVEMGWNEGSHIFTDWLRDHSKNFYSGIGQSFGMHGPSLTKAVTVATLATSTVIKSAPFINPLFDSFRDQHTQRRELARKIAPVLSEIKGSHSVGALMNVSASQNEMIFAQRKRLAMKADTDNMNNLIKLIVNVTPGFVSDFPSTGRMWNGKPELKAAASNANNPFERIGGLLSRTLAPGLSSMLISSNNRVLRKKFASEYSALDMALTLEDQVEHNPKAYGFQLPGKRGESLSLEDYIVKMMIQHQKDMADILPDHTELRAALKEDMSAAAAPLAEAIKNGDMSALALVRLIGEGKIIKNKGRAICTADEVAGLIQTDKPKAHKYTRVDAKEFYANASFTKKEMSEALKSLEGEEKQVFAAMFPDSILEEAGMKKDEITSMRTAMMERYEHHLAEAVTGVAAKSDEQLKQEGLAGHEIKQIRKAADALANQGEQAIKELKSGLNNANGIERAMMNLAVPRINGDKHYFGALLSKGREEVKNLPEVAAEAEEAPYRNSADTSKARSRKELITNDHFDAADDEDFDGFAEREDERRSHGSHHGRGY